MEDVDGEPWDEGQNLADEAWEDPGSMEGSWPHEVQEPTEAWNVDEWNPGEETAPHWSTEETSKDWNTAEVQANETSEDWNTAQVPQAEEAEVCRKPAAKPTSSEVKKFGLVTKEGVNNLFRPKKTSTNAEASQSLGACV